jgi:hypothetical protein
MKRFSIPTRALVQALAVILILSACGANPPEATSTPVNMAELQKTVVVAAFTVIAETQAAIPTATLQPTATVTNTPAPTPTFVPVPSSEAASTPLPGAISGAEDPCIYEVLPATLAGKPIKIRVDNPTKATLNVSVYLQQTTPQSVCGYRSYTLAPQQALVINDLVEGCYTLWAWNPDPAGYFMVTNGSSCLDASASWTFDISSSSIKLRP